MRAVKIMFYRVVFWGIVLAGIIIMTYGVFAFITSGATPKGYSSVFLTNGQVYFGKVESLRSDFIEISDVFYFKNIDEKENETILVRLGSELHAPKNTIIVNKRHILYFEELSEESKVVGAIKEYKEKKR